jgi:pimeloyl-ACP methyl ester carboxylesterase
MRDMTDLVICAAHPAAHFGAETADLLSAVAGVPVVCVGPPPGAGSLDEVVEAVESERRSRGIERWVFWGMSGGSFLGQLYAHRHPEALAALVLASSGPYFRPTVEDPACILCPEHPAWRDRLATAGLLTGSRDDGPTAWLQIEGVGWVFRRAEGAALLVSPEEPSPEMRTMMPALWAFDARPWLGTLHLPALVMCGSADPIVPLSHARALAACLPGAAFEIIEGAGHIPVVDRRDRVEVLVRRFLAGLRKASFGTQGAGSSGASQFHGAMQAVVESTGRIDGERSEIREGIPGSGGPKGERHHG